MNVEIRQTHPKKVLCMTHRGPYNLIGETFQRFGPWAKSEGIRTEAYVGIYYDDPTSTPPDELRADAGAFVDMDFTIDNPSVHIVNIPAGTFAIYTHVGSYDLIGNSWQKFMAWFATSGYQYGSFPSYEIYVDDCDDTPVEHLQTELFISIG